MVWGGIHKNGKTELGIVLGTLTAFKFCGQFFVPYVVPFFQTHDAMIFQQDNARPHSAIYTRQVLAEKNIVTLEWPSRSPDLSPFEYVWDILGMRNYIRNDVNYVRQLEAALLEEWANIEACVTLRMWPLPDVCYALLRKLSLFTLTIFFAVAFIYTFIYWLPLLCLLKSERLQF